MLRIGILKKIGLFLFISVLLGCGDKEEMSCTNPQVLSKITSYYKLGVDDTVALFGEAIVMNRLYQAMYSITSRMVGEDKDKSFVENRIRKPSPLDYTKIYYSVSNIRTVNKTDYKISCKADVLASFNNESIEVPIEYFVSKYEDKDGFSIQQTKLTPRMVGELLAVIFIK